MITCVPILYSFILLATTIGSIIGVNKNNLASQYKNIQAGYILYLEDDLDLSGLKVLIKEINFKGLKIVSLTDLISEERS